MQEKYAQLALENTVRLLGIDSPSGYTENAAKYVQAQFAQMGYDAKITRKGGVLIDLGGEDTQEQAARKLGKSRSALANSLRLLNLPETVLELLKSGFINTGHAKVVLGLPTPELQAEAAQIIADNQLNVRQAEALCKKMAKPAKEPREPAPRGTLPVEVEESLKQVLGSEVNVAYHGGKGKLTVHFYSDEQLRAFANLLGQYQMETE